MSILKASVAFTVAGLLAVLGNTACTTNAFCFADCGEGGSGSATATHTVGSTGGSISTFVGTASVGGGSCDGSDCDAGNCVPTNGGVEICDGLDNDCDGIVDDIPGLDLTDPHTCGVCNNDCFQTLLNNDPTTIKCTPSKDPGKTPGTCTGKCAQDYYDLDNNGTCEYYCTMGPDPGEEVCNGVDDNCNGQIDENVDLCSSTTDCGYCGHNCVILHGTPACVNNGTTPCDKSNTQCEVASCECNGPMDCWWDNNKNPADGCEYPCFPTNGGVEICDGIDNDCDGVIDDNLGGDPKIGATCFGSAQGVCADPSHAGQFACVGAQYVCQGANVLLPNTQPETCNGLDDDCDGTADDNLTDTGMACGTSNIFPCTLGSMQCVNAGTPQAMLGCVGEKDPQPETCNGIDDDCDGTPDDNLTDDKGQPCDVPPPPPAGAKSACSAGTLTCVGGVTECKGAVTAQPGAQDTCGVDQNCDGQLTNQPDITSDVHNCGGCGIDCYAGAVHSTWACVNKKCVFQGCLPGWWDNGAAPDAVKGDDKCGYPCTFVSSQELCNGVDDNCDGQIDEGVVAPSPVQVCGVSSSATTPECTSGVKVSCGGKNGWQCAFPAGVCSPSCSKATEICDGLDNNCNGQVDENVPNKGQPCASDDSSPGSQGVCRTTGTFVCNGNNATKCSAVEDLTKAGPELCDGIDNDCDGLIDEPFTNKGSNATYYVQPVVTKIAASTWIYSYEASRPNANGTSGGSGNGYWCASGSCPAGVTAPPSGTPLNKTPACSVAGRIPWINVTPAEVEETCNAMGGHICGTTTEWEPACEVNGDNCTWGYNPPGAACTSAFNYSFATDTGTKYCNLAESFDFDGNPANGAQDNLLPTGSPKLQNCYAGWSGLLGNLPNPTATQTLDKIYDITGNVREITKNGTSYELMGGAFTSASDQGATCTYTFYQTTDPTTKLYDLGFRCCFSQLPD